MTFLPVSHEPCFGRQRTIISEDIIMSGSSNFAEFGFSSDILEAVNKKGFQKPTEVQQLAIPKLLQNANDLIVQAQTGTGKTAAFGLPIVQLIDDSSNDVQAIVLAPTRELAVQVKDEIDSLCLGSNIRTVTIYGGQAIETQFKALKKGPQIIVGTPGRVIDHLKRKTLNLQKVTHLILDEADEMLNMGFIEDLEVILAQTNPQKRTCMFSATMPKRICELAENYMNSPEIVKVQGQKISTDKIEQQFIKVKSKDKVEALSRYLQFEFNSHCIIFCRTRADVDLLTKELNTRGVYCQGIHGEISQSQREKTLQNFREKHLKALVATDVAARGIDVTDVTHVINFSIPNGPETYIHRIGRTGRAGKKGKALTFVLPSEYRKLMFIQRITKMTIEQAELPEVTDLIERKKQRFESELARTDPNDIGDHYYNWAKTLLTEYHPSILSAYLLKQVFGENMNPDGYAKVRQPEDEPPEKHVRDKFSEKRKKPRLDRDRASKKRPIRRKRRRD